MSSLIRAAILYAVATLAAPTNELVRKSTTISSHPLMPVPKTGAQSDVAATTEYSYNWAGAALVTNEVTEVCASFNVPTVTMPSGGNPNTQYGVAAWVGIDGDTCGQALLQCGLTATIQNGVVTYSAFYEWVPGPAYFWSSGISFDAGDTVHAEVVATSSTSGTATVWNFSKNQMVNHTFTGQPALCEQNAEWIVEDFEVGGQLIPLANFSPVTFSGAEATVNGQLVGVSGATIIDLETKSGQVEATARLNGAEGVIVTQS